MNANNGNDFPLAGLLEFALRLELFGVSVKRQMRLVYALTPDWPYYHPKREVVECAFTDSAISCELKAEASLPNTGSPDGALTMDALSWVSMNSLLKEGVLGEAIWKEIEARINHDAKLKDVENRLSAYHPVRRRRFNLDRSGV